MRSWNEFKAQAEHLNYVARVAELIRRIEAMEQSWSQRETTPAPETISSVIRQMREMTDYRIGEEA